MTGPVAHMNFGILRKGKGHPDVAEFWENVERVNAAAARSEGFIGRPDGPVSKGVRLFAADVEGAREDTFAQTMSLWASAEALDAFVHKTIHGRFLNRRSEWFLPLEQRTYVIWPIAEGHVPDLHEARQKLDLLSAQGPGPEAYDFGYLRAGAEVVG